MGQDFLDFITGFGEIIRDFLFRFKIPGTNWSALGFFIGIFLLILLAKLLHRFFGGSNGGGKND